jgi:hypothetical protein
VKNNAYHVPKLKTLINLIKSENKQMVIAINADVALVNIIKNITIHLTPQNLIIHYLKDIKNVPTVNNSFYSPNFINYEKINHN